MAEHSELKMYHYHVNTIHFIDYVIDDMKRREPSFTEDDLALIRGRMYTSRALPSVPDVEYFLRFAQSYERINPGSKITSRICSVYGITTLSIKSPILPTYSKEDLGVMAQEIAGVSLTQLLTGPADNLESIELFCKAMSQDNIMVTFQPYEKAFPQLTQEWFLCDASKAPQSLVPPESLISRLF